MIRPLRARHRRMIVVLAIAVPTLFGLGLRARRAIPPIVNLPAALEAPVFDDDAVIVSQSKQIPGAMGVTIRRLRPAVAGGAERLFVEITEDPHRPELLAYWAAQGAAPGMGLPEDARLLGPLLPTVAALYDLPASGDVPGTLVLYSLAQAEVVDSIELRGPGGVP